MQIQNRKFKTTGLKQLGNQKGQTLIEYLVIVAILGVGSIVVMRSVGHQINSRFANVVSALGGTVEEGSTTATKISKSDINKKTLKNFADGAKDSKKSPPNNSNPNPNTNPGDQEEE